MVDATRFGVHGCEPERVSDGSRLALCQTLSIECPSSIFSWHVYFVIPVSFSLSFFCVFVFFFCSHWSLVDVPLIFFCPADHVPDWQPRILLGLVEARSVNVKKTTTIRYYVVCWTEKDRRNIYKAPTRAKKHNKKQNKNDKKKGTKTKHIAFIATHVPTLPATEAGIKILTCVFCYSCSFLFVVFCVFVFFFCSHWSLVDVPLIFFCPADHVPDWQPRVLLGMVEARSVNVKKTTTTKISLNNIYCSQEKNSRPQHYSSSLTGRHIFVICPFCRQIYGDHRIYVI